MTTYWDKWYAVPENRAKHNAACAVRRSAERSAVADLIREAKDVPCADCKNRFPYPAMDFDHVRGEKKFDLAHANWKGKSLKRVREEIEKCEVVCSNCHRVRTYERKYGPLGKLAKPPALEAGV